MDEIYYLGQYVNVVIDRPLGSLHPVYGFKYPVNYGYIPNTVAGDNEELDAYVLGINEPIKEFRGKCVAIIERLDDNENKLIVIPDDLIITDEEIYKSVEFQEKYFDTRLIR